MKKIGYYGGPVLFELGPVSDVVLFFDCVDAYVPKNIRTDDWNLIADRLYCRYLRCGDLYRASAIMEVIRATFSVILTKDVCSMDCFEAFDSGETWLDPTRKTLVDVFEKYFNGFSDVRDATLSFLDAFNIDQPIRLVIADLPGFARDKRRSLADYDSLSGTPFWRT